MNLSNSFTLAELTVTKPGIANVPTTAQIEALRHLCETVLQPVRDHFGPVSIHVGFRSPALNSAVGGAATSQHLGAVDGDAAADFHVSGHTVEEVVAWMRAALLPCDQVIAETRSGHAPFTWVHASVGKRNRREYLQSVDGKHYAPWAG